jgi:hypothetical protein
MGRVNKTIEGVFVDVVGTSSRINKFDEFINAGTGGSPNLIKYTAQYKKKIDKLRIKIQELADLEEIILQKRIEDSLNHQFSFAEDQPEIKIYKLREYLYARCSFYRTNTFTKDIRVNVALGEFWDDDLEKLEKNPEFMSLVQKKLLNAIESEIQNNITNFNKK